LFDEWAKADTQEIVARIAALTGDQHPFVELSAEPVIAGPGMTDRFVYWTIEFMLSVSWRDKDDDSE